MPLQFLFTFSVNFTNNLLQSCVQLAFNIHFSPRFTFRLKINYKLELKDVKMNLLLPAFLTFSFHLLHCKIKWNCFD